MRSGFMGCPNCREWEQGNEKGVSEVIETLKRSGEKRADDDKEH